MFRVILLFAVAAVSLDAHLPRNIPMLDGKIVGGVPVTIEEHPYQISLLNFNHHNCGGSIMSSNKILTAAHCTDGRTASQFKIRASSTTRDSGGQVIAVKKICQHPNFDYWTLESDVSVLILEENIDLGKGAQPIELIPSGEDVKENATAVVTGWGSTASGRPSTDLQAVFVTHITDKRCKELYSESKISDSMICFGLEEGGKDSCQGDSGGPLVSEGRQVGVVSWGYGCAVPKQPGVYAKIAFLRDHIDSCDL